MPKQNVVIGALVYILVQKSKGSSLTARGKQECSNQPFLCLRVIRDIRVVVIIIIIVIIIILYYIIKGVRINSNIRS